MLLLYTPATDSSCYTALYKVYIQMYKKNK